MRAAASPAARLYPLRRLARAPRSGLRRGSPGSFRRQELQAALGVGLDHRLGIGIAFLRELRGLRCDGDELLAHLLRCLDRAVLALALGPEGATRLQELDALEAQERHQRHEADQDRDIDGVLVRSGDGIVLYGHGFFRGTGVAGVGVACPAAAGAVCPGAGAWPTTVMPLSASICLIAALFRR